MDGRNISLPTQRGLLAWCSTVMIWNLQTAAAAESPGLRTSETPPHIVRAWRGGLWRLEPGGDGFAGQSEEDYGNPRGKAATNPPPYRPAYAQIYERVREAAWAGTNELDYGSLCLPYGMPSVMGGGIFEMVFQPRAVHILIEEQGGVRRIWLDGRKRPSHLKPQYNGFSVGHWEGATLVVETTHIRQDTILDTGAPHSRALRVIERMSPAGVNRMRNEVTIIDPEALTRPWKHTWHYARNPDWVMQERVCVENNRTLNNRRGAPGTLQGVQSQPPD